MKYIKATIMLFIGMVEAILLIPVMFFVIPVRKWNETLYGKQYKKLTVREYENGKVEMTLPNGEVIYGDKEKKNDKASA